MSLASYGDSGTGVMSADEFRAFYDRRPDRERWELIAGVPIMMTDATMAHQVIGDNFSRLLNDAMDGLGRPSIELQRAGVEIPAMIIDLNPTSLSSMPILRKGNATATASI